MALILPNDIANGQLADGERLQQNNDVLETWANQEAITRDGATAMTAPLLLAAGTPTVPNQAVTKAYVDAIGTPSAYVWTNYTPTLTVWTIGNGTRVGRYIQIGKLVNFAVRVTFGSTSVFTTGFPYIGLPPIVPSVECTGENNRALINVSLADATGGWASGHAVITGGMFLPLVSTVNGSIVVDGLISSTTPFPWAVNDSIFMAGFYEAA